MNNKTEYTFDLLLKSNLFLVKDQKRKIIISTIVSLVVSIVFLVATYFTEDIIDPVLTIFAIVFLGLALFYALALIKSRKKIIADMTDKSIADNPRKHVEYQFTEDHIQANVYSDQEERISKLKYSFVSNVTKIDNTTCYFMTKDQRYYIIYDEQGIDGYCSFISEKI